MIAIIDYRAGNSPSVLNAFCKLGVAAELVTTAGQIAKADGIILPGVGSADATMKSLNELGLIDTLNRLCRDGSKPFLGICVGLQVLFGHSDEGGVDCLGWFEGNVKKFAATGMRVPQMGWNKVRFLRNSPLNAGVTEAYLYFVNSYHAVPRDLSDVLAVADYGGEFCALAHRDNIFASQCHLEKSGRAGLKLLENFANYCAEVSKC